MESKQLEELGQAWSEYKKTNDERLDNLEKGRGVAELEEKQAKMDSAINGMQEEKEALKKELDETKAAVVRMSGAAEEEKEAKSNEHFMSGIKKWAKAGMPDSVANLQLNDKELKAMQSNIDTEGGYTVPTFMGQTEGRVFDTSPVRSFASVQTIGTNRYEFIYDDDEMGSGWVGEVQARPETSTPQLGKGIIEVKEQYANAYISQNLLEDSDFNLEQWLNSKAADKFGRAESTAFVSGSDPAQPQGLMTGAEAATADVYERGAIGTVTTAGATAITSDEIIDLRSKLQPEYRGAAVIWYNRNTEAYIRKLKDGQGNYLWQPSFQAGEADMLIGQRTAIFEDMPDIATGAKAVGIGDLRSTYQIIDRVGMSVLKDPYTVSTSGNIRFYFRKRCGAGIKNWASMKYLKQA